MGRKITLEEIKNGWLMTDSASKEKVHYKKPKEMLEELGIELREKQQELAS
jgi:hypothetical protein